MAEPKPIPRKSIALMRDIAALNLNRLRTASAPFALCAEEPRYRAFPGFFALRRVSTAPAGLRIRLASSSVQMWRTW